MTAPPFAKQWVADVRALSSFDSSYHVHDQMQSCPLKLFTDPELSQQFVAVDVSVFASHFLSCAIPRPGLHPVNEDLDVPEFEDPDKQFMCNRLKENGSVFGASFSSLAALHQHIAVSKGGRMGTQNLLGLRLLVHSARFVTVISSRQFLW